MIELTLRAVNSISEVAAEAWDACANPAAPAANNGGGEACPPPAHVLKYDLTDRYNPFISHDFLSALEVSQSVRARAGWQPMHLIAEEARGEVIGAVPCYAKSHSRGEYVFDHGWAEAYERAGGSYYPKLQVSVPFTPGTARRGRARASRRCAHRRLPALRRVLGSRHLSHRAGMGAPGRARLPQTHSPAVPLGKRRLCQLRRVPGGACLAQTKDHPARTR